jgi:hypothetical protein
MADSRRDLSTSAWGAVLQVHAAVVPLLDQRLQAEAGMPLSWYDAYVAAIEQHFSSKLDDAELRTLTQLLKRVLTD